jgi:hypothetical protein
MIKFDLNNQYRDALELNLPFIIQETGAKIQLPNPNYSFTDIFVTYDIEMKSRDFDFIYKEDLPIMVNTVSSVLYVLSSLEHYIKLHSAPKSDKLVWN